MRVTVNLAVKGTRYHKAAELLQNGSLSSGLEIRLKHQPDNPHDKNAVAVLVNRTGAMLGHLSRELAPKYATLVNSGKIIEAYVADIRKNGAYINIDLRVVYEQSDDQLAEKHSSRLWMSYAVLPETPGVYLIQNIESGRQYIGSSNNIKERVRSHIGDLLLGRHANHSIQSEYNCLGLNYFEAKVILSGIALSCLTEKEAEIISSALANGAALYNSTEDGQGLGRKPRGYPPASISDRLTKGRAETEQGKSVPVSAEKMSGAKSCFVATACFGSSNDTTVMTLRRYREAVLKQSTVGRMAVYWYYKLSPPIANYVANTGRVKTIARMTLVRIARRLAKKYDL